MNNFLSALGFLTLLPVGRRARFDAVGMVPWFPVAGLVAGLLLATADWLFLKLWPVSTVAVLDVVFLAVLTGGLHLDGLSDTADGLLGHHAPERALEIMKDSRVGAMGAIALVCCAGLKWAGLSSVTEHRALVLLLVPALARGAMLFPMRALPYGRAQGTGKSFFDRPLEVSVYFPLLIVSLPALLLGARALLPALGYAALVLGAVSYYRRRLGVVTGDMLGALCETAEAVLFLLAGAGCAG
jgi:adenosylcobinamide-GDP ribazoletransferase